MTQVDDIKARIDIVELVGESIPLRKTGRTFKAPCPFHTERTPSFIVNPDRQTWHCFGACAEGGDIFSWVMKREGLEFREALRMLADRAGVSLTPLDARADERSRQLERLQSANETAATFFQAQLRTPEGAAASTYLDERGLTKQIVEDFGVGYAPDSADALQGFLSARGFSADELRSAGLLHEATRGLVDRFRNRIIYPIRDNRGHGVGFGGRALGDALPKYLNTAQTPLFDKSALLYGLDRSHDSIRLEDRVIIVEGYMDVIAAHQHGQRNVVASMGTALTEKQVALIKPITHNILLALDADAAGAAATVRGIDTTRQAMGSVSVPVPDARGLVRLQDQLAADICIIGLPPGQDPDDLIRRDPDLWAQLIREAPGYLEYRFRQSQTAHNMDDPRERSAAVQELLPLVATITEPVVQAEYLSRLAAMGRVQARILEAQLRRGPSRPPRSGSTQAAPAATQIRLDKPTAFLLQLLIARPEVADILPPDAPALIDDSVAQELLRSRLTQSNAETWLDGLPEPLREIVEHLREEARHLQPYSAEEAQRAALQAVDRLRRNRTGEELRQINAALAETEQAVGRDTLARDAYALDAAGGDGGDDSPAALVLRIRAKQQALHAHALPTEPDRIGPLQPAEKGTPSP